MVYICCISRDNVETDDEDENLAASSANVDDAGEGVGVCRTTKWSGKKQISP